MTVKYTVLGAAFKRALSKRDAIIAAQKELIDYLTTHLELEDWDNSRYLECKEKIEEAMR